MPDLTPAFGRVYTYQMMQEGAFSQFASKKAYEICYAVFRVASQIKHDGFADHLERRGLELLESAVGADCRVANNAAMALEYLLRIGADANVVNPRNAQVIIDELGQFNSAIAELSKSANIVPVNLEDIFSKLPVPVESHGIAQSSAQGTKGREAEQIQDRGSMPLRRDGENDGSGMVKSVPHSLSEYLVGTSGVEVSSCPPNDTNGRTKKSEGRKSAILDVIRQNGNLAGRPASPKLQRGEQGGCRLKEIQDALPDVSERTVRYDIQSLIEQGIVERIGNGGPATYYRGRA